MRDIWFVTSHASLTRPPCIKCPLMPLFMVLKIPLTDHISHRFTSIVLTCSTKCLTTSTDCNGQCYVYVIIPPPATTGQSSDFGDLHKMGFFILWFMRLICWGCHSPDLFAAPITHYKPNRLPLTECFLCSFDEDDASSVSSGDLSDTLDLAEGTACEPSQPIFYKNNLGPKITNPAAAAQAATDMRDRVTG